MKILFVYSGNKESAVLTRHGTNRRFIAKCTIKGGGHFPINTWPLVEFLPCPPSFTITPYTLLNRNPKTKNIKINAKPFGRIRGIDFYIFRFLTGCAKGDEVTENDYRKPPIFDCGAIKNKSGFFAQGSKDQENDRFLSTFSVDSMGDNLKDCYGDSFKDLCKSALQSVSAAQKIRIVFFNLWEKRKEPLEKLAAPKIL